MTWDETVVLMCVLGLGPGSVLQSVIGHWTLTTYASLAALALLMLTIMVMWRREAAEEALHDPV